METRRLDGVRELQNPRNTRNRRAGVKLTMEACCIMFSVKPEMEKNPDGLYFCVLLTPSTRLVLIRRGFEAVRTAS